MKIGSARNPAYMNVEHTIINLWVKFDGIARELPFTAMPNDVEEHGRVLFENAVNGDYGEISSFVEVESE